MTDPVKNLRLAYAPLGDVSQFFGENKMDYRTICIEGHGCLKGHNGIDIVRKHGEPLYATEYGKITEANVDAPGWGTYCRIQTEEDALGYGRQWTYGHLSALYVKKGQYVREGQLIGLMGNTGFSTGTHLHLGVRDTKNGNITNYSNGYFGAVDPLPILRDMTKASARAEETARRLGKKVWMDFALLLRKIGL